MKVLQQFGLTHLPLFELRRDTPLWENPAHKQFKDRFDWLSEQRGVGVLTGEAGVGKTALLRHHIQQLPSNHYQVVYQSETCFSQTEVYRYFAMELGLQVYFRRSEQWRALKQKVEELQEQSRTLIWILDEAQGVPPSFLSDLPSFMNFAFDSQRLLIIWLVGLPELARMLRSYPYQALSSRVQVNFTLSAVAEPQAFSSLLEHALSSAGCTRTIITDEGLEMLRIASQGRYRQAGQLLKSALFLACKKGLDHLPDTVIEQAIEEMKS